MQVKSPEKTCRQCAEILTQKNVNCCKMYYKGRRKYQDGRRFCEDCFHDMLCDDDITLRPDPQFDAEEYVEQ